MRKFNQLFRFMTIPLISLFLFSCGGGSGGDASSSKTGTVTLLVTDAPSDQFSAINLTVTQAELISDAGSVVLFSGLKTFDLLQLASATEIFSVTDVAAGSYNKIRLTLTDIELVMKDGSPSVYPALPGNGKLDLNSRGGFSVVAGESLILQLDMDAEKSIKVTGTGSDMQYQFRPVVFFKVVNNGTDTKLVRLQGEAYPLDRTAGGFDLCYINAQGKSLDDDSNDGNPYCVMIDVATAPASFFDASGNPADITMIGKGDIVTAVGRFAMRKPGMTPSSKDEGDDRSEDSNSNDDESRDNESSDDDSSDDGDYRKLRLVAEVIWAGDFEQINGNARGPAVIDAEGNWFKFMALPGQSDLQDKPIDSAVAFRAMLQNGTKLFSRMGEPLTYDDIQDGVAARVDGIFDPKLGDLKSALVILDIDAMLLTQLTGTIASVESDYSGMMLVDLMVGDRCVVFSSDIRVFETALDGDGNVNFEQRQVFDLAVDQMADVFGDENTTTGCLEAQTIIYETQAMITPVPAPIPTPK